MTRWRDNSLLTLEHVSSNQPEDAPHLDYFKQFLHAVLHPVMLFQEQQAHKTELRLLQSLPREERHPRDLAEMNERYAREFAHIQRMVWALLMTVAALIGLVVFLLIRYVPPALSDPSTRRNSPVHFTIPVLSPFTSVIEHETSAVNVQLVAVLLLAAGISFVIWLKCCMARR
ncbi:hypothetical protein C8Q80DRAFT_1117903 [Daedaleopsis nitida]|nr:hypothetical protein C8Q80DRAFT_1117903 [Daedaleopsis nitida]